MGYIPLLKFIISYHSIYKFISKLYERNGEMMQSERCSYENGESIERYNITKLNGNIIQILNIKNGNHRKIYKSFIFSIH